MDGKNIYYPLTHPQMGIWYTDKLYPETCIGNIAATLKIVGDIDISILDKAINIFIRENDGMRLRITEKDGIPYQNISDYEYYKIDFFDFSKDGIEALYNWDSKLTKIPFNLKNNQLYYFAIFKVDEKNYGFYIKMHHIISDAWSFVLLGNQVMHYYNALINKLDISSIKPESYIDYIQSEIDYSSSERFKKDKVYWNEKFKDMPDFTTLKSSNTNENSTNSRRKTFVTPQKLSAKIREYCIMYKMSPFTLFCAALSIYLYRVTGKDDIVIGTPVLNRSTAREKETIGMFINTIPLRIEINKSTNFNSFLINISKAWLENLRHQKYPYDLLLKDLRGSNKDIEDLYDIVLSYQNAKVDKAGAYHEGRWHFNGCQRNSLSIHINDREGSGNLILDYDYLENVYNSREIEFLHDHIIRILWHAMDNPSNDIYKIEMVSEKEKKKLLFDFNSNVTDYSEQKTLNGLFEEQVSRTPDNVAVVFEDKEFTYREINDKANQLASKLRKMGVKPDDIIGLMVQRSQWLIIGMLGILKAGGAFLPCDPEYPDERVRYMLEDSKAAILVSQGKYSERIENIKFISVDEKDIYSEEKIFIPDVNKPSDLAYIIYTSGSTGNPKGVMIEHRAVNSFTEGVARIMDFSLGVTVLSITTISFDVFIFEIVPSLLKGLRIILANEDQQKIPKLLGNLIGKYKIQKMHATPSRIQMLAEDSECSKHLIYLKEIIIGGEIFTDVLLKKLKSVTDARIFNGYGPTETTVGVTFKDITDVKGINIGKPLANAKIYILDENRIPLPIGIPGEIYISGDTVGRGYLNKSEYTRERFIENPFVPGMRMYRSGDIGRWYPQGEIQFIGRIDNQVKIRGYRIELGEIESKLLEYKGIKEAVVLDKTDEYGNKYLCAYIVSDEPIMISDLRLFLARLLPKYMVPAAYVQIEKIPLTHGGKINRSSLPVPQGFNRYNAEYVPPSDEFEEKLLQIWSKILNIERIGMDDNIFDLGVDSLAIISFISNVSKEFNVDIELSGVYNSNNMHDLKKYILDSGKSYYKPISIVQKQDYYPLYSSQKRLFILSQLEKDSIAYNMPWISLIDGKLDTERLHKSFKCLAQRHDAFRTSFHLVNDNPVQRIADEIDIDIEYEKADESEIDNFVETFSKPFDLSKAPLVRIRFLKLDEEKHLLLFDMHHIISDGISIDILLKELNQLYKGEELPEIRIQYKDYVIWKNEFAKSAVFEKQKEYWMNKFSDGVPVANIAPDYLNKTGIEYEGRVIEFALDSHTTSKLKEISANTGNTLFTALLATYYILLWKYTGQEDIVTGTPVSGRKHSDLSGIVGIFVNMLALRCKINADITFLDFLDIVQLNLIEAISNQDYPYEELVINLKIKREAGRNAIFDTMFVFQNTDISNAKLEGLKLTPYERYQRVAKYDLSWEAFDREDKICFTLEYKSSLYKRETILRLISYYRNIIKSIVNNPESKLVDMDMLGAVLKNKVLNKFNDTSVDFDRNMTIHRLIEAQVQRDPEATALVFENECMSYGELNAKANQLAHVLRAKGVRADSIVGIMLKRSFEMVIGILAILKAGGAYLPIDPEYPENRIECFIHDSGANIILTQKNLMSSIKFTGIRIPIDDKTLYNGNVFDLDNACNSDNLSYVLFTSGSSGRPKGVMITHKSVINLIIGAVNQIEYSSYKTILSVATMSFDIFFAETILPLTRGMKVVIANEKEQRIPQLFFKLIKNAKVDMIQMTPSRMKLFLENMESPQDLRAITDIIMTGEALPEPVLKKIRSCTTARIYDNYGPTETTIWSSIKELTDSDRVIIGRPIANTWMYILDKYMKPVPPGVAGELYIGGVGVAKGYINNEEMTRERFIQNPFIPNELMYKTGDLVKWLPNGEIDYLGRIDFQVKIRGYRIELGEIENKILKFNNIKAAVVIDRENMQGEKHLVAYLVSENGEAISNTDIRRYLSNELPDYMVPSNFITIDSIPMTPNGKTDRKMLPAVKLEKIQQIDEPTNQTEEILAKIWAEVLHLEKVGINSNFFELGGDSLAAILVQTKLFGRNLDISTQDFYKYQTVREMADKIDNMQTTINEDIFDSPDIDYMQLDTLSEIAAASENNDTGEINGILLTGATGFLGIHILYELVNEFDSDIYCLVRGNSVINAEQKLKKQLDFYFKGKLKNLIGKRIYIINGDIGYENFGLSDNEYGKLVDNVDLIIHTAANVKHFGDYSEFEKINVFGTGRVAEFAAKYEKKLYHISTISVFSGDIITGKKDISFSENKLYVGQNYRENVYVRSKFEAERLVIDYMRNGLKAAIIRIGNLTGRYNDGHFQFNIEENAFYQRIKSIVNIGCIPDYSLNMNVEFSPVDICSKGILHVLKDYKSIGSVFHMFNNNLITINKMIDYLDEVGIHLEVVSADSFKKMIYSISNDSTRMDMARGLIQDITAGVNIFKQHPTNISSRKSVEYLKKKGFVWTKINRGYIYKLINYMVSSGFLEGIEINYENKA